MTKNTFAIGYEEAHIKVKSIMRELFPNVKNQDIKVLDAAAGNGHLTKWFYNEGYSVTPVDVDNGQWALTDVKCEMVDLNKPLPFASSLFDIVVSVETIEHVENPYQLIREFSRVLKTNGFLIITTPNVHGIKSRLKYLIVGFPVLFEYTVKDALDHLYPINIGQLLTSFDKNSLVLENLYSFGSEMGILQKIILRMANEVTKIFLIIMKWRRRHLKDHYLYRLSSSMLNELMKDVGLVVVATKK